MPAPTPAAAEWLHDPLTGLLSRAATLDALARALSLADRLQHPVTVLFVEIDGFGLRAPGTPDTDRLEQTVARRLAGRTRTHEVLGHWARGQFLAVLPDADVASALVLTEDLHDLAKGALGGPSVSIGVHGRAPTPAAPLHDLTVDMVVAAQRALEATESNGPGRTEIEP